MGLMGFILNILGIILLEQRTYSNSDYSSDYGDGDGLSFLGFINLLIIIGIVLFITYHRSQKRIKREEEVARKREQALKAKKASTITPAPEPKPQPKTQEEALEMLLKSSEVIIAGFNYLPPSKPKKEKKEKKAKFSWSMRQNYYGRE